jgi:hypothetical protein
MNYRFLTNFENQIRIRRRRRKKHLDTLIIYFEQLVFN